MAKDHLKSRQKHVEVVDPSPLLAEARYIHITHFKVRSFVMALVKLQPHAGVPMTDSINVLTCCT